MLKDIINVLKDCFTRYKGVNTFKYQSDDLNNSQGDYASWQVYVDDVSDHNLNITDGTFTAEFQIMILSHVDDGETILDKQDEAYSLAATVVEQLDRKVEYQGILRVHDYSILTCSHITDDDSAGVRLTLVLQVPNPADLCYDQWQEPVPEPEDEPLELNPITLPKKPLC